MNFWINSFLKSVTHKSFSRVISKDDFIFKNPNYNTINLKSLKSLNYFKVEFTDFPYLGIWAKPNGDFICIEPWQGISDSVDTNQLISKKEGIVTLKQKCSYHAKYSIALID